MSNHLNLTETLIFDSVFRLYSVPAPGALGCRKHTDSEYSREKKTHLLRQLRSLLVTAGFGTRANAILHAVTQDPGKAYQHAVSTWFSLPCFDCTIFFSLTASIPPAIPHASCLSVPLQKWQASSLSSLFEPCRRRSRAGALSFWQGVEAE